MKQTAQVTLKIEGTRAVRGVSLSDFEGFIDQFLRALRDFDRSRRQEPGRKTGRPERRAELVTAFRLIHFAPGSGVATLEPDVGEEAEEESLFEGIPLPLDNLRSLVGAIEKEQDLSEDVADALDRARRSVGDDGSISIELPEAGGTYRTVIDEQTLERLPRPSPQPEAQELMTISGRLHLVDLEPDRIAIRTSGGIEWVCHYPEALEGKIRGLIGEVVWATGSGRLTSALRGGMELNRVEGVLGEEQSALFTLEPVPTEELLTRHGVAGPQGLGALADPDWTDDESDETYIAAIFGDE